ncbi:hypothetical protein J3E74DRAFT_397541, partial [Bipolaris maydis]
MTETQPAQTSLATDKSLIIRRKRRPARPQIDPAEIKTQETPQTGTIYNVWYKQMVGRRPRRQIPLQTPAQGRCNIARDSGYTKADKTPGAYFCLFFARGTCPKGVDCEYLHRLPTVTDIFPSNVDCFGRDKHADYRDDMVRCRNLPAPNSHPVHWAHPPNDDIEEVVARHMQEWGEIERTTPNSQFAKEAMDHQSFDHNEILNVRWATVDPNPQAAKREARRIEEQAAEAIRKALPAAYVAELEGRDPEGKKRRKVEGSFGLQGYEAPDDVWYAKEKGEWKLLSSSRAGGAGDRMAIEGGDHTGILSGSTLAALKGFKAAPSNKRPAPAAGPLVDYG